jgi:hypothetical protein
VSTGPTAPGVPGRSPIAATVSVHVYPGAPMRVRLHPEEDRAVLILGDRLGCPTILDLYLPRAELVALRDTLHAAVTDLDTPRQTQTPRTEVHEPAA